MRTQDFYRQGCIDAQVKLGFTGGPVGQFFVKHPDLVRHLITGATVSLPVLWGAGLGALAAGEDHRLLGAGMGALGGLGGAVGGGTAGGIAGLALNPKVPTPQSPLNPAFAKGVYIGAPVGATLGGGLAGGLSGVVARSFEDKPHKDENKSS